MSLALQTDEFEDFRHEQLREISQQLIQAKRLLQDIDQPRYQCLRELSLRMDFVAWVREALGGTAHRRGCGGPETAVGALGVLPVPAPDHVLAERRGRVASGRGVSRARVKALFLACGEPLRLLFFQSLAPREPSPLVDPYGRSTRAPARGESSVRAALPAQAGAGRPFRPVA